MRNSAEQTVLYHVKNAPNFYFYLLFSELSILKIARHNQGVFALDRQHHFSQIYTYYWKKNSSSYWLFTCEAGHHKDSWSSPTGDCFLILCSSLCEIKEGGESRLCCTFKALLLILTCKCISDIQSYSREGGFDWHGGRKTKVTPNFPCQK